MILLTVVEVSCGVHGVETPYPVLAWRAYLRETHRIVRAYFWTAESSL
jgi:hypothetical protein